MCFTCAALLALWGSTTYSACGAESTDKNVSFQTKVTYDKHTHTHTPSTSVLMVIDPSDRARIRELYYYGFRSNVCVRVRACTCQRAYVHTHMFTLTAGYLSSSGFAYLIGHYNLAHTAHNTYTHTYIIRRRGPIRPDPLARPPRRSVCRAGPVGRCVELRFAAAPDYR